MYIHIYKHIYTHNNGEYCILYRKTPLHLQIANITNAYVYIHTHTAIHKLIKLNLLCMPTIIPTEMLILMLYSLL